MKPFGKRVILKVDIINKKQPNGTELEEPSQEAKVIVSNNPEIKKGSKVMFNYYGAISIDALKTRKNVVLVVDEEDIYALL